MKPMTKQWRLTFQRDQFAYRWAEFAHKFGAGGQTLVDADSFKDLTEQCEIYGIPLHLCGAEPIQQVDHPYAVLEDMEAALLEAAEIISDPKVWPPEKIQQWLIRAPFLRERARRLTGEVPE